MVRRVIALGLGAALGYAAGCGSSASFICAADDECSLAGTPGICTDGFCAYPDDACASGFAYPQSSPSGMAGECVDGVGDEGAGTVADDGSATGGMDGDRDTGAVDVADDDADADADADGSTGSPDDGMDADTMAATDDTGVATTDEPTTGNPACEDDVGDTNTVASPVMNCEGSGSESLLDNDDADWFAMGGGMGCPGEPYAAHFTEGGANGEICIFAECTSAMLSFMCYEGTPDSIGLMQGCCGNAMAPPIAAGSCGMTMSVNLFVRVTADPEAMLACEDYSFMVGVANG